MTRDLQPAPFEPPWLLGKSSRHCLGIPLMDAARVEEQCSLVRLHMGAVSVAEDDRVCARETAPERMRQAGIRMHVAEAQRP
jgi:hypothetical protein